MAAVVTQLRSTLPCGFNFRLHAAKSIFLEFVKIRDFLLLKFNIMQNTISLLH